MCNSSIKEFVRVCVCVCVLRKIFRNFVGNAITITLITSVKFDANLKIARILILKDLMKVNDK